MAEAYKEQAQEEIFALDIGTRSIIGVVGRKEGNRLHVLAIDEENHNERAMLDGQIVNIDKVAGVARIVVQRLESRLRTRLSRVCVAAAGRALRTEEARFTLELPNVQQIGEDIIGQLEAGAVSKAEEAISEQPDQQSARFYMVGYTAAQYVLDGYPMATLKGHSGKMLEADVVATFLPREVVDSLYAVVGQLGLEVASLTLEPIASLNATIPADIRLLNLVLVDIGAGTSDIAVCRDGSVVGYTMATVAGDETTELLMRALLVDFQTGERLKTAMSAQEEVRYTDILGIEHTTTSAELRELAQPSVEALAKEIAGRVIELNSKAPSAVFLAGGGSKLAGLRERVAESLRIDPNRVAIAGNQFERNAFSEDYTLNDPEYATPLGIAISAAMGMINDSYIVLLNGEPAKLFRSGVLTLRDILLMNGYHYSDLIGRSGANVTLSVNGKRQFFRGALPTPAEVEVNGRSADLMDVVHAGDNIRFQPAQSGGDGARTVRDVVGEDFRGQVILNGALATYDERVHTGDELWLESVEEEPPAPPQAPKPGAPQPAQAQAAPVRPESVGRQAKPLHITFNGSALALPGKENGEPYYLMDLLEYSGVDFDHLDKPLELRVNGEFGQFSQKIENGDSVTIE